MRRAAVLAAGAALALGGCGGDKPRSDRGVLVWSKEPLLFSATHLPNDRVLIGTVRNRSGQALSLVADRLTVRDADNRRLRAYAVFTSTFAHGLYGAYQQPNPVPPAELRRLGHIITLEPHKTAPLTVAYRLTSHTRAPLRIDYGRGTLSVPRRTLRQTR
ncbi:MAG: hypothetical protein QOD76_1667 [Solirubrobacteraceae bacterium]|nr:hypothetical protein [Solirubrobacteraceae bacterium]